MSDMIVDRRPARARRAAASPKTAQLALDLGEVVLPHRETPLVSTTSPLARYKDVDERKLNGATYTPWPLATYLANSLVAEAVDLLDRDDIAILDPAVGDGVLVDALVTALQATTRAKLSVTAFETDSSAAARAQDYLSSRHPDVNVLIRCEDFLESFSRTAGPAMRSFGLVIANPPYVRTQVLGASEAKLLAQRFGLKGRVDLYHAFLLAMAGSLAPGGLLAVITSNRFMTTRGASALRRALHTRLRLLRIWDLGDTKVFDAAVLPALLVAHHAGSFSKKREPGRFTSIYETTPADDAKKADDVVGLLDGEGVFRVKDGRTFVVKQGTLDSGDTPGGIWRLSTSSTRSWLDQVVDHTWAPLRTLGRVRVGVKTTADRVFIREDWSEFPNDERPELLRPLITHHVGRRYRASAPVKRILYPHLVTNGARVVADLNDFPRTARYLEQHRATLEARTYVIKAGRRWYEIWVPQDPAAWCLRKLVFRDICERPMFWVDEDDCVVNGDCYWLTCDNPERDDLLWLAAGVCNSTFIEQFYDKKFNNKLYAGRRRFITQYVEEFPLPDPESAIAREIIHLAKERGSSISSATDAALELQLDQLVWRAFGFSTPTPT